MKTKNLYYTARSNKRARTVTYRVYSGNVCIRKSVVTDSPDYVVANADSLLSDEVFDYMCMIFGDSSVIHLTFPTRISNSDL